jgi:hypothetical protein
VQQFVDLKRFADEVPGAALDGLDGVLDCAVASHDNRHDFRIACDRGLDDSGAVDAGETKVRDDDVERELGQLSDSRLPGIGLFDVITPLAELIRDSLPEGCFVLNEKQMFRLKFPPSTGKISL